MSFAHAHRSGLLVALLAALPAMAVLPVAAAPARAAEAADPAARLVAYNAAVVEIMKAKLPLPARITRFETLVRANYDLTAIAATVVGPKWSTTSAADREAAVAALGHHSAVSLARNFDSFEGERFITDPNVLSRGTSSIVKVTIASKDDNTVLQYRLRQSGEWRIVDVVADGVSQLALQRAELAGTIASEGVAGMAKKLAERDAEALKK